VSRSPWRSRRAVVSTLALIVWVPGCAVAAWWQVGIALGGDSLGWVYSVMWPCFAVFGTVFWWFLVHDDPETVGARGLRRLRQQQRHDPWELGDERAIAEAEAHDPELAAYNAYLAGLADRPKSWRKT
jgi:hypothetical protein